MNRITKICVTALCCVFISGCFWSKKGAPVVKGPKPPSWVLNPEKAGFYSAVGVCGKTLFRKDARDNAAEDARANLALALESEVKVIVVQVTDNRGTRSDQTQVVEASKMSSDIVMEQSEIQGYWVDKHGAVDKPMTTYALARIPKTALRRALVK
ncbi:MAG: hypothetical protein QF886_08510 [Planctomycetota bacterium]|jgi:hypothetical protein|nr:hypothetical protein [Planctomycetota bacterium]